jgi:hypothetical protein
MEPSTVQDGLFLRTARKEWRCQGAGGRPNKWAEDCPGTIAPGTQCVECLWEAPAYQSGIRVCVECAVEHYGWQR